MIRFSGNRSSELRSASSDGRVPDASLDEATKPPATAEARNQGGPDEGLQGFARVAWSRGAGCSEIASLLATEQSPRIAGDLRRSCVEQRVDVLVTRKLSNFDLVPVVIPHHVALDEVESVTAAVGTGPHSRFAADVAAHLADRLGVPAVVATVARTSDELPAARERLSGFKESGLQVRTIALTGPSPVDLVESLDRRSLLVVGAPGGSWLQRHLFGAGHRLIVSAPAGALVVRSQHRRCFHLASDSAGFVVGPDLLVKDALQVTPLPVVPVAERGRLVGVVRREALAFADGGDAVASLMEPPRFVRADEALDVAIGLQAFFRRSPVPVVDDDDTLIGVITPSSVEGADEDGGSAP